MIISTKIGQTSFVNENGTRVSATVLDYNSCTVVGNRTIDRDGYLANIIGFLKPKKLNKPQLKEFNKFNALLALSSFNVSTCSTIFSKGTSDILVNA